MPRPDPPVPPAWEPPSIKTLTLKAHLITPMFGGGHDPGQVDVDNPIRGAAVRGHLRFWWRALYGAQYETPRDLADAERDLWGSDKQPGAVGLRVTVDRPGERVSASSLAGKATPRNGPLLGYFLFPFLEADAGDVEGCQDIAFTLTLTVASEQEAVLRRVLQAWLAFGGVGARTRRGCGALAGLEPPWSLGDRSNFGAWLQELVPAAPPAPAAFSRLQGATVLLGPSQATAQEAWRALALFWSRFRKGHVGSVDYTPVAGGRWEDFRALQRFRRQRQAGALPQVKPYLGLPIIYQRFGSRDYYPTLEAESTGRMASPVILRPLLFADGRACPLVLLLNAPAPRRIRLDQGREPVSLEVQASDPVLQDLGAATPLQAVRAAALGLWGTSTPVYALGATP